MKKVVGPPIQDVTSPAAPSVSDTAPTDPASAKPTSANPSQNDFSVSQPGVDPKPPTAQGQSPQRQPLLPPRYLELQGLVVPSLTVGAGAAATGALVGAVTAIVRSDAVRTFSLLSGVQWFTLGSSYYAAKQVALKAYGGNDDPKALDKVKASGIAGGFAGMMGGMLRGPRNIVPGIIVWSLLGAGGQAVGSALSGRNFGSKYLASRWSPVTPLTDRQYEKMLEEKLLKLDAEIAIINDNIKEIRDGHK